MAISRSIRSCNRARTADRKAGEGGFVLVTAIVLAVLYFALMELLLLDSSRQLIEAQRFRARVIASNLAESGAELAAEQIFIAYNNGKTVTENDWQGDMSGSLMMDEGGAFIIEAKGTSAGVIRTTAHVTVRGLVTTSSGDLRIDFTDHAPE